MSISVSEFIIFDSKLLEERDYWMERLSQAPPPARVIPQSALSLSPGTAASGTLRRELPGELTAGLLRLSGGSDFLLFTALLSALKLSLSRYGAGARVCVGTPALREAARPNALAVLSESEPGLSFRDWLLRVRAALLEAYARQQYPFERLRAEAGGVRPFAVAASFEGLHGAMPEAGQEVWLRWGRSEGALWCEAEWSGGAAGAESVGRLLGHVEAVLESALAEGAGRLLRDVEVVGEPERARLVGASRGASRSYEGAQRVEALIGEAARRHPAEVAVVGRGGECISYEELERRASAVAGRLRALGVGAESLVGVVMERSAGLAAALLGVLKAGAGYVPMEVGWPEARRRVVVEESGCRAVLAEAGEAAAEAREEFAGLAEVVEVEGEGWEWGRWEEWARAWGAGGGEREVESGGGEGAAYVIYTSGSTGRPKGVVISHRALRNYLLWCLERYDVAGGAGAPVHSSVGFDLTVTSLFLPLLAGRKVLMVPEEGAVEGLGEVLVVGEEFSLVKITPAHLEVLGHYVPPRACLSARSLVVGGEALFSSHLSFWREHSPATRIFNEYGPTEATVGCCVYEVPRGADLAGAVPIGRPIANAQLYLLDAHMRLAPEGVAGEVYIGGDGVARGYLKQPALTAERFVPDPFSAEAGARLYRTGDLARQLPDGNLEYLGRTDAQVKIRGYRIELQEIEAVMCGHAKVAEAAVTVREDVVGDKRLVAYYVARQGARPAEVELRAHLAERLPDYMVPSAFILLDALPLTPNGKIDRRALPAPEPAGGEGGQGGEEPRTVVEELLADMWAEVLRAGRVRIHDNFFRLGGHSLLATQLISRVRETFRVELPLRALFEAPTVAGLAAQIETAVRTSELVEEEPIVRVPHGDGVPLSFSQQRLWFISQLEPGNPVYNVPAAVRVEGPLDVAALRQAFNEIVRRHEVLRTTVDAVDGTPVGRVAERFEVEVPVEDLRALPEVERGAKAHALADEAARAPFDLARGPLLRVRLLRTGEAEHVLLVMMHHIVSDAWSADLLVAEVRALYEAFARKLPSPLPPLKIQYADYAHWQQNWLRGRALETQLDYWKRQLAGSPPVLALPTDRPRPAVQTYEGAGQSLALPASLRDALKDLSRREGVTLYMTLLAAFDMLLQRYSGQDDLLVGTTVANRTRPAVENLIGFFVNTLVLRADISGDPTFRELLGRVRGATLAAFTHQDLPFEMLVRELDPERSLSYTPLFQVTFDLVQGVSAEAVALRDLKLTPLALENRTAQFALGMTLTETPQGMTAWLQYDTALFDSATITRMLGHYRTLLESVVEDPGRRVSALRVLSDEERERLLYGWNETRADYPAGACLHTLFEEQAARTPANVALVVGGARLTYAELNERADRLARHLRRLGVGPEAPVGICVERSPEMAVAILGVLKAGGAYLPLSPSDPPDRLRFMIEDARPAVLLTQRHLCERLPASGARVVQLDTGEGEADPAGPCEGTGAAAVAENLAYVIYTSGSTGRPKGSLVSHRSLVNYVRSVVKEFGMRPADRVLQFAPLSFDVLAEELFPAWLSGAAVVLPDDEALSSFPRFLRLVEEEGLTLFELPASFWHQWVRELEETGATLPASLRLVIIGCEKISPRHLAAWERFNVALIHIYGLTETTVTSTLQHLPPGSAAEYREREPPIGRPIANTRLYVLDARGEPVPAGVPGELFIGGAGVGRGYLNRPALTAERFLPDPFSAEPGARLYRTGDLVRHLPDGRLEFLGRLDHQVKVRGFRVETGEVEAALLAHPSVAEAAVVVREDTPGDARLVAYVVGRREPPPPGADELYAALKERLPDYMLPSAFVPLEALPLTATGKVDRAALPAPSRDRAVSEESFVAPRSPVEETLAAIWRDVLGVERVGVHDNFFHLGGHSLLAIQVISRVRDAFLVDVPLRLLFEAPTVAGLALGVVQCQAELADEGKTARLLGALEHLTEEQLRALLAG